MNSKKKENKIEIYTDGSCLGNPGPGGWGVLILINDDKSIKNIAQFSGSEPQTTNNRMEMIAIIKALQWLHENFKPAELQNLQITIYSDSSLLISTLNLGWKRKANLDLWQQIDKLRAWLNIKWNWVKAHAANKHNNHVDKLALAAATKAKKSIPREN